MRKLEWIGSWIALTCTSLAPALSREAAADNLNIAPPISIPTEAAPPDTPAQPPASAQPTPPAQSVTTSPPPTAINPPSQYPPQPPTYQPPAPAYQAPPPDDYYPRRRSRRRNYSSGPPIETTTALANFRFAGLGVYQSGSSVYSLAMSWNPQISLRSGQYLGLNLGGTMLSNALAQSFLALEYQLTIGLPIAGGPVGFELGLGAQTWTQSGDTSPLLSGTIYYRIPGSFIERVFAGYSAYLMNYFYTSEVKLGVGISF